MSSVPWTATVHQGRAHIRDARGHILRTHTHFVYFCVFLCKCWSILFHLGSVATSYFRQNQSYFCIFRMAVVKGLRISMVGGARYSSAQGPEVDSCLDEANLYFANRPILLPAYDHTVFSQTNTQNTCTQYAFVRGWSYYN